MSMRLLSLASFVAIGVLLRSHCGFAQTDQTSTPNADPFPANSIWASDDDGMTLTVLERSGQSFRGLFVAGDSVERLLQGTVKGKTVSWLAADVQSLKGGQGGDNTGRIRGDRIDFSYRSDAGKRTYTLHRRPTDRVPHPTQIEDRTNSSGYSVVWELDAAMARKARTGEIVIPVPSDESYLDVQWELVGVENQRLINLSSGQLVAVQPVGRVFELTIQVLPTATEIPKPNHVIGIPDDAVACLHDNHVIATSNPLTAELAAELKSNDPVETIHHVRTWLRENMKYKAMNPTEYWHAGGIDHILSARSGLCAEYSILFAELCRMAGVPARVIVGPARFQFQALPDFLQESLNSVPKEMRQGEFMGHGWAEVFIDQWGWIPLEPQSVEIPLGQIPPDRVPVLHLNPADMIDPRSDALIAQLNMDGMKKSFGKLKRPDK